MKQYIYVYRHKSYMKLAYRLLILFIAVVLVTLLLTYLIFVNNAKSSVVDGVSEEALRISTEVSQAINGERARVNEYQLLLKNPELADSLKFFIDTRLREVRNSYASEGIENVYTIMLIDDILKVAGDPADESALPLSQDDYAHLTFKRDLFTTGASAALKEPYTDEYGVWISAYSPIKSASGQVLALLGVDLPLGAFAVIENQVQKTLLYALLFGVLLSGLLSVLLSRSLTGPVNQLIDGLRDVRKGNLGTRITAKGSKEMIKISTAFNDMASELEEKENIRSKLNQAVSPAIAQKLLDEDFSTKGEIMVGTILFADIRGFTSISEAISAPDTIHFVNEFLSIGVPIIQEKGGIIEKFVGDEIFAVFGGPISLEDDANQAVHAALAIQERITAYNKTRSTSHLPELHVGIGICTGMIIGGVIGTSSRNNYTFLGSTVNEGSRICSLAKAGEVIINKNTYLRVRQNFDIEELPPSQVKGKQFALHTFLVKSKI